MVPNTIETIIQNIVWSAVHVNVQITKSLGT